jgi:hypothetical protein
MALSMFLDLPLFTPGGEDVQVHTRRLLSRLKDFSGDSGPSRIKKMIICFTVPELLLILYTILFCGEDGFSRANSRILAMFSRGSLHVSSFPPLKTFEHISSPGVEHPSAKPGSNNWKRTISGKYCEL